MSCEVIDKYFLTLNSFLDDEKSPKDYGSGILLYSAEINFINAIYNNPGSNSMELSKILGITKGAITQCGNKLEDKEIIVKYLKDGNKKEKYYRLTELGKEVFSGYIKYHNDANKEICNYLSSLNLNDRKVIIDFLDKLSNLNITKINCNSNCCNIEQ